MKKKLSKLMSLVLSLVMVLSLTVPAFAAQDTEPPLWERWGYSSMEEMLADGWTETEYYDMAAFYIEAEQAEKEREAARLAWLAAHAEEAAAFDENAYFEANYNNGWYDSAEEYMAEYGITEYDFRQEMLNAWAAEEMAKEELQQKVEAFKASYPAEYAAFDPYAYFAQEYPYYDSAAEYMEWYELTEEEFRLDMLESWMASFLYILEEKTAVGGSATGINVMVNGQCIPFTDARPEITNSRTMVPMAAAMEYLGADVSYDQATHTALVSMDGYSFTHAIGTQVLDLPNGETFTMDTASYIQNGRTMVPVAFFAQYLGFDVYWDDEYKTAILLDRDAAAEAIDANFTLLNRLLYTLSGEGQKKDGQSLKNTLTMSLDLTMLDSIHGDQKYSISLKGSELSNDVASQVEYTFDLNDLFQLLLDMESSYAALTEEDLAEYDHYRSLLSDLTFEIILDLEGQCMYIQCPIFAEMDVVEDPDAWVAMPLNGMLDASALATESLTVGQLMLAMTFSSHDDSFRAWSNTMTAVDEIAAYVGDDCFTKSGSSYAITWDMAELDPSNFFVGENFTGKLRITPSGSKGCTYSLTMDLTSPEMTMDVTVTGSAGKMDMDGSLHVKNVVKAVLEAQSRISATRQKPQTAPPAGAVIEYPAGLLGSSPVEW